MSDDSFDDLAAAVAQITIADSIALAMSALVFFDYLITFRQEVCTVWQRRPSVVSLLIVSTRWCLLFEATTSLYPYGPLSCTVISWMNEAPQLVGFAQTALFSALRVYAIWDRNAVLSAIVLVLSLAPVVTNSYFFAHSYTTYIPPPLNICVQTPFFTDTVYNILIFFTRIPLIVADALVLALTWAKTHRQYREARALDIKSPLATCLVQDGAIYFVVLLALNVAQIATFNATNGTIVPMVSALASTLPPILVCRFMMNLRLIDDRGHATSGPDITSRLPSFGEPPVFMANMGEPLEYEDEAPWDDAVDIVNSDEGHSEDGSSS